VELSPKDEWKPEPNGIVIRKPRPWKQRTPKQVAAFEAARALEYRVKVLLCEESVTPMQFPWYYNVAKMVDKAKREVLTPEELKARVARVEGKARNWGLREEVVKKILNVLFGL
jgi:hypothetical protein